MNFHVITHFSAFASDKSQLLALPLETGAWKSDVKE